MTEQKRFTAYKIKTEDTLQSLSAKLNISLQELRNFHNLYAKQEELISIDLHKGLEFLYIYPTFEIEAIENVPKVTFIADSILQFQPKKIDDRFGVMHTITEGDEINTIKFEISIKFVKTIEKFPIFEVNRLSEVFVNDEEVNTTADQLAAKCSEILYPLHVVTNDTGQWIGVNNFKDIQERWQKLKIDLEEEYQGEWFQDYVSQMDDSMQDEESLTHTLKGDWMLFTYFNAVFLDYTKAFELKRELHFPFIKNAPPVKFSVNQSITKYLNEYNTGEITFEGHITDERSTIDIERGYLIPVYANEMGAIPTENGTVYGKYFFSKSNKLETAYLSFEVQLEKLKKIETVVSKI
jgi:hypothetical protein